MKNRLTLISCHYTRDWEKTLTFIGTIWFPSPSWGGDILNKRLLGANPMVVTTNPLPVSYAKGS